MKYSKITGHPLPEDLEVRGFVGLRQSLLKLDFVGGYASVVAEKMQHPCRCYRSVIVVAYGEICDQLVDLM